MAYNIYERNHLKYLIDSGFDFSSIKKINIIENDNNKKSIEIFSNDDILSIIGYKYPSGSIEECTIEINGIVENTRNISDYRKLYNYLSNLKLNDKTNSMDREFYQEVRIAKGLMNSEDYKKTLKEKIKEKANILKNKSFDIMKKIITTESIIKSTLSIGAISIVGSMMYQIISDSNVLYTAYSYDALREDLLRNTVIGFTLYLTSFVAAEKLDGQNLKKLFINDILPYPTLSIVMALVISFSIGIVKPNFNRELTLNSMINLTSWETKEELDKKLSEKFGIDFKLSYGVMNKMVELNKSDSEYIEAIYKVLENSKEISEEQLTLFVNQMKIILEREKESIIAKEYSDEKERELKEYEKLKEESVQLNKKLESISKKNKVSTKEIVEIKKATLTTTKLTIEEMEIMLIKLNKKINKLENKVTSLEEQVGLIK